MSADFDPAAVLAAAALSTDGPGRPSRVPPAVAAARKKESSWRTTTAGNRARQALVHLHRNDYEALYAEARRQIDAERGPLPTTVNGDELAS